MLRHTFVDNWLRNGGAEVDLARLAGWTTARMAERYAQHRADERAVTAHKTIAQPAKGTQSGARDSVNITGQLKLKFQMPLEPLQE